MFMQIAQPFSRTMLIILLVIWAGLLFGGFGFGRTSADGAERMPTWARLASSLTLVGAAWLWLGATWATPIAPYAVCIATGMSLGFCGDLAMAKLLPVGQPVLWGMTLFGLGHIAYSCGFLWCGNRADLTDPILRWGALAIWLAIGLLGWYFAVYRGQQPSVLHWVALPYALLLAGVAGLATGLALQQPRFIALAVGTALFLISDLILATRLFNGVQFRLIGDVIWLTYGPAQALIVYSVACCAKVLRG